MKFTYADVVLRKRPRGGGPSDTITEREKRRVYWSKGQPFFYYKKRKRRLIRGIDGYLTATITLTNAELADYQRAFADDWLARQTGIIDVPFERY